jgi:hypothetical protein
MYEFHQLLLLAPALSTSAQAAQAKTNENVRKGKADYATQSAEHESSYSIAGKWDMVDSFGAIVRHGCYCCLAWWFCDTI